MTEQTLVGLPLEEARERLKRAGLPERAEVFTAPPGPSGAGRAEEVQPYSPYVVREGDAGLTCALFRVPDPSKEHAQHE